jgi:hypothetical protein
MLLYGMPPRLPSELESVSPRRILVKAALTCCWPLALNLLGLVGLAGMVHTGRAWFLLSMFCVVPTAVLVVSIHLWKRLLAKGSDIEAMVSSGSRADLATWIRSIYAWPLQFLVAVIAAGLGVGVLVLSQEEVSDRLEINVVSYLATGWASILGGLLIYVLVRVGQLAYRIESLGTELTLDFWEPASTPGMIRLSQGYILLLMIIAASTAVAEGVASRVPGYQHASAIHWFFVGAPVCGVALGILTAILPQRVLYRIILDAKFRSVSILDLRIMPLQEKLESSSTDGELADLDTLHRLVDLRSKVLSSPALPFGTAWLVPSIVALLGPFVAFLLGLRNVG